MFKYESFTFISSLIATSELDKWEKYSRFLVVSTQFAKIGIISEERDKNFVGRNMYKNVDEA